MKDNVYSVGESYEKMDYTTLALPKGEYETCRFVHCNFEKADLSSIKFIECEFEGCNISLTKLENTAFDDVLFKDCKMMGLHFEHCKTFNFSVRFENSILNHSSFYGVKMKGTKFSNSKLVETDFTDAMLSGASFDNCDLQDATFENTNLEKVDFRTAINYRLDPELNMLNQAKFSQAGIHGLLIKYGIDIYQ